jgi:hypothetical protein
MKTLFIANATTRNHHLHYRVPEQTRVYEQVIQAGGQIQIPPNHRDQDTIVHIVMQIEGCGAVHRSKIQREDGKKFSGLVFDEKPISEESIRNGFTEEEQSAIEAALTEHQKAAISSDDKVAKLAQEAGTGVGSLEVEIAQQPKPGEVGREELTKSLIQVQREGRPVSERSRQQANRAKRD